MKQPAYSEFVIEPMDRSRLLCLPAEGCKGHTLPAHLELVEGSSFWRPMGHLIISAAPMGKMSTYTAASLNWWKQSMSQIYELGMCPLFFQEK